MNASLSDSFLNNNEIITDITIQLVSIIHPHAICISIYPWLLIFKLIKYRCSLESSQSKQPDLKLNKAICSPCQQLTLSFSVWHRPWFINQCYSICLSDMNYHPRFNTDPGSLTSAMQPVYQVFNIHKYISSFICT